MRLTKRTIRRLTDRALNRLGLVRQSQLPVKSISVAYRHPETWGQGLSGQAITVKCVLRDGRHIVGDMHELTT